MAGHREILRVEAHLDRRGACAQPGRGGALQRVGARRDDGWRGAGGAAPVHEAADWVGGRRRVKFTDVGHNERATLHWAGRLVHRAQWQRCHKLLRSQLHCHPYRPSPPPCHRRQLVRVEAEAKVGEVERRRGDILPVHGDAHQHDTTREHGLGAGRRALERALRLAPASGRERAVERAEGTGRRRAPPLICRAAEQAEWREVERAPVGRAEGAAVDESGPDRDDRAADSWPRGGIEAGRLGVDIVKGQGGGGELLPVKREPEGRGGHLHGGRRAADHRIDGGAIGGCAPRPVTERAAEVNPAMQPRTLHCEQRAARQVAHSRPHEGEGGLGVVGVVRVAAAVRGVERVGGHRERQRRALPCPLAAAAPHAPHRVSILAIQGRC